MEEIQDFYGEKLSLTTPVPRDHDVVFPGENWFFYWKTSASLWESKIKNSLGTGRLFVPINWSFHTDTGDQFDFATTRPETDLKRLVDIAESCGREVIFLLPISPAPFLPNGGVPHLLARNLATGEDGLAYSIFDSEKKLTKLYSFYDPRVFQGFSRFVSTLGQYFSMKGIGCDVWGIDCGRFEESRFRSFFRDSSKAFEMAFSRFIQAKKDEHLKENPNTESSLIETAEDEIHYKREFQATIRKLYFDSAKAAFSANWEGLLQVSFLGANNSEFFNRLTDHYNRSSYTDEIYESMIKGIVPSSVLIPYNHKGELLERQLDEIVNQSMQPTLFTEAFYDNESTSFFRPLRFFEIYQKSDIFDEESEWEKFGLMNTLKGLYEWTYLIKDEEDFYFDESLTSLETLHVVSGKSLDEKKFRSVLKLFMNGGKVLLDTFGLEEKLKRRLESFYLENSLDVEKLNYFTSIHNVTLGEGRLVLFDGEGLEQISFEKYDHFWQKILSTFEYKHFSLKADEDIDYVWRKRASSPSELNYEEVRRLSLYNPTSYKKKIQFSHPKNFAMIKIIDERNTSVETSSLNVSVEMLPGASVSFDFGVFS